MRNNRKKTNVYLKFAMIILISAAAGAVFGFAMFWFVGDGEAEPAIRSVYSRMQTASLSGHGGDHCSGRCRGRDLYQKTEGSQHEH